MLILSSYIANREFKPLQKSFSIDDLLDGARKVVKGLAQKVSIGRYDFQFFKVRIGSKVKGRMIVFAVSKNQKIVPLLIRLKKDKKVGMNMSANNPFVVDQINRNLDQVLLDIEKGEFEEFEL
ncbi:hypothetical protein GF354_05105 [Candidatus Peregrinibacteria bacterium]|nr:hypothetical protein [Candidatus Peregrinibacteria bacterium]